MYRSTTVQSTKSMVWLVVSFFFFKQKTSYDRRIRDWISDVCSSVLEKTEKSQIAARGMVEGMALDSTIGYIPSPDNDADTPNPVVLVVEDNVDIRAFIANHQIGRAHV